MKKQDTKPALFRLGDIFINVRRSGNAHSPRCQPATLLDRHVTGDWSNLSPGDIKSNRDAVARGARVLSSYRIASKIRIWLIKEGDRASSTNSLPDEYYPAFVCHTMGPPARHPDRKWTGRGHHSPAEKASLAMRHAQPPTSAPARFRDGPIHGFKLRDSKANTYTRDISAEDALLNLKRYGGAW